MKTFLSVFLFLIPTISFSQSVEFNPDYSKSSSSFEHKSDFQIYYNPKLDKYDIHFVQLDLNVTDQSTFISGNATIIGKATENSLDTLVFDFKNDMIVDSAIINGVKRAISRGNDEIIYIFNPAIPFGDEFSVKIYYHGTPSGGGVTSSLSSTWGKRVTWTLSESFHAYEWWPCKQVLSDKIDSVYLNFTCDNDCKVGSNGLLKDEVTLPNNKKRFEWKTYYPINYYLISFAVAEYQDYSIYSYPANENPILIQNYIYNTTNCLNTYKSQIDETANFIELFSEKFGLYPFSSEKYGHCLALLSGGMEHQTMTTLNSFSYNLVSHELAHQWFGDYVTCATWQDIWINEGFASYAEYVALENLVSYSSAQAWMADAHSYALGQPTGSVYIPFQDAKRESRIFSTALSYKKGAAIIHILRSQINNDDLFFASLKNYLELYKNNAATGDNFKNSIEESTGLKFDLFFNQWYYGKGFPTYKVGYSKMNDTLKMTVSQTTSSVATPLFNLYVEYKFFRPTGDTIVRLYQTENNQTYNLFMPGNVTNIKVDPNNWIVNNTGAIVNVENYEVNPVSFSVYPNPVKNILNIHFDNLPSNHEFIIFVFRSDGTLQGKYICATQDYSIDVFNWSPGVYFIESSSGNIVFRDKFIKY